MQDVSIKAIINWDEFFMGVAALASMRSKDPSTRHGACIVNGKTKRIISVGYSGMPLGDDDNYPWDNNAENRSDTKYPYVIHSEMNAIFNANAALDNATIYIYSTKGYLPCSDCMKSIVQVGIKEIVLATCDDSNTREYDWAATKKMINVASVKLRVMHHENMHGFSKIIKELQAAATMS